MPLTQRTLDSTRRASARRALPVLVLTIVAVMLSATVAVAATPPTTAEVDAGLLTASDFVDPPFTETGRATPDPTTVARPEGGVCNGRSTAARALAADDHVAVAGASFALAADAGAATFNEDAWVFKTAKAAKAFMKSSKKQLNGCTTWSAMLSNESAFRNYERQSFGAARLGDQGLQLEYLESPPGEVLEQPTSVHRTIYYARIGGVVATFNFGRRFGFQPELTAAFVKDAVTKLKKAIA